MAWVLALMESRGITKTAVAVHLGIRDKNKINKDLNGERLLTWTYIERTYLKAVKDLSGENLTVRELKTGRALYHKAARTTDPHEPITQRELVRELERLRAELKAARAHPCCIHG